MHGHVAIFLENIAQLEVAIVTPNETVNLISTLSVKQLLMSSLLSVSFLLLVVVLITCTHKLNHRLRPHKQ